MAPSLSYKGVQGRCDFKRLQTISQARRSVDKDLLQQIFANDLPLSGDGVQVIGSNSSAENGSFIVVGDLTKISSSDLITLDVTGLCAKGQIPLKAASKSIVFKYPQTDGGFSEVSSLDGDEKKRGDQWYGILRVANKMRIVYRFENFRCR